MTEFEFEDLFKIKFGAHFKKTVSIPFDAETNRKFRIHVKTGNMSEENLRLILGAGWLIPGWGPRFTAKFADADGNEVDFNSMFLTADGVDPLANQPSGHPGIARKPRENGGLKANTDYYLDVDILDAGAPGSKNSFPVTYYGTDYDGQYMIEVSETESAEIVINGVPGIWHPVQTAG